MKYWSIYLILAINLTNEILEYLIIVVNLTNELVEYLILALK